MEALFSSFFSLLFNFIIKSYSEEVVASSYRLELSQAEAVALFDKLDADKSGALSRQELGVWGGLKGAWDSYRSKSEQRSVAKKEATKEMAKEHIKAGTPSLADLFAILDTDKNGILTRSEVLAGANQLDLSISQVIPSVLPLISGPNVLATSFSVQFNLCSR